MWKDGSRTPENRRNGDKGSDGNKSEIVERSDGGSRSRSRSRGRKRSTSFSRSRSGSHSRSKRAHAGGRSRTSRYEPTTNYDNRHGRREEPEPSRCLGIFGLSLYTTERDLREMFGHYGVLERVQMVFDHPTGRSRGFGFVYFKRMEDAIEAKERLIGTEVDGHKIRVDFSITKRAHTPTPGVYMGSGDPRSHGPPRRSGYRHSPASPPRHRGNVRYRDSPQRYSGRHYEYEEYERYSPQAYRSRYRSPSPARYYDERRRRRSRSYEREYY